MPKNTTKPSATVHCTTTRRLSRVKTSWSCAIITIQPVDSQGNATSNFLANGEILKVLGTRREQELHGFTFREAELQDTSGGTLFRPQTLMDSLFTQKRGQHSLRSQRQVLYEGVCSDYPHITNRRDLYLKLRQDPDLNALQVKYAYAMTCHKAQGGQWKEVYLSFGYLTPEMINLSFCRWLYTAMTRATEKYTFSIHPPLSLETLEQ